MKSKKEEHEHVFHGDYGKDDLKRLHAYCHICGEEMEWPQQTSKTTDETQDYRILEAMNERAKPKVFPQKNFIKPSKEGDVRIKIKTIVSKYDDPHDDGFDLNVTVDRILTLFQSLLEEERGRILESLKLWRPYFYRDKITDEDIAELPSLTNDTTQE